MQEHIDRLTAILDDYKNREWGTVINADLGREIWPDLQQLYERRNNIPSLKHWKYYKEYTLAEFVHTPKSLQTFPLLSWETSFVLTLLFNIYHS